MKKIEITLLGRNIVTHDIMIWRVKGEKFAPEYSDEKEALGIGYFGRSDGCSLKWAVVNLYTGLFVCGAKSKDECKLEFYNNEERYKDALKTAKLEDLRKRFLDLQKA